MSIILAASNSIDDPSSDDRVKTYDPVTGGTRNPVKTAPKLVPKSLLSPPGQASVKLRKAGGFEKVWNGGGKLELVNLPEGSYIVNVTPVGGTGKRDTLDVKPGTSCAFTYQMSSQSWTKGDCK